MPDPVPQQTPPSPTPPPTDQTPPTPPTDQQTPPKPEDKAKPPTESLLNEKEEDKAKPEGAPEKYEPFKLADGYELIPAVAEEAQALFKELDIPQAGAQKLVDFYVKNMQAVEDATYDEFDTLRGQWRDEIKADPQFPQMKTNIGKALAAFTAADPKEGPKVEAAFRAAMNFTGAGDNPAFIRVLSWLASFAIEGTHVSGAPSPGGQEKGNTPATGPHKIYPNLPSANAG